MLFLKPVGNTAIESFLSNTFCIIFFCSDLSCRWNCLSCRIRFTPGWYKAYSAGQTVPSTAQIRAEENNTKCVGKKRFNGSVTHRLQKEHKLVSRQSYNAVPFVTMEQKKKLQLKHKNSLFTLQTFHYNNYWWSQSLLNRFGWEIYAFQSICKYASKEILGIKGIRTTLCISFLFREIRVKFQL
jgi:hypothetical protein